MLSIEDSYRCKQQDLKHQDDFVIQKEHGLPQSTTNEVTPVNPVLPTTFLSPMLKGKQRRGKKQGVGGALFVSTSPHLVHVQAFSLSVCNVCMLYK